MQTIKFFLDPISDLETWLNGTAKKGYRLKASNNFVYNFEKTDKNYSYSTQFIGANSSRENDSYIQMLKENGTRVYRAPLNQGNIAFGKFRFRPYAHGDGKIANSFQGYNKEILVVENGGKEPQKLLTDKSDLAEQYKNIRNAYLQGFLMILALFAFSIYKLYESNFEVFKLVFSGISGLVTLIIATILLKSQKNYNKHKNESDLIDWY